MTDNRQWLIEEVQALGQAITKRAVRVKDGSVAWRDPWSPTPAGLNPHFYDGTTGVAFFLGALARQLGKDEGQELALLARQAIAPIRHQLRRLVADPVRTAQIEVKLGAVTGIGAYIYCFAHLADWLEDPELAAEAQLLATLITQERIAADRALDIASGSAGALLALLCLEKCPGGDGLGGLRPIDRAELCSAHLLRQRVSHRDEPRAWAANGYRPFCGFLHGAAGFAYAFGRLFELTADPELRTAVTEAREFEEFHFDSKAGNWPDLRAPDRPLMVAWCHGAAGVALGRAGLLPHLDDEGLRAELAVALETTRSCREQSADHPCCGNLGRAEVLLEAHRRGLNQGMLQSAVEIVRQTIEGARKRGRYRYSHDINDERFSPTFFRGAAGVGYTLLRFADPEAFPCVLTFQ